MHSSTLSLTAVLDGVGGQHHNSVSLTLGKRPGWVDRMVGLDWFGKLAVTGIRSQDRPSRSEELSRPF
jgi:hypothetical protein